MSFFSEESRARLEKFNEEKKAKFEYEHERSKQRDAAYRLMESSKDPVEKAIARNTFFNLKA